MRAILCLGVVSAVLACHPVEEEQARSLRASSTLGARQLIGDIDGFGISPAERVRATPAPHTQAADVDGDGLIEPGEYLPDWNKNGRTAVGQGDDFDFRSAGERAATNGAQWTDRSVTPAGASHGATFRFAFSPPVVGDSNYGVDHFINFVFGDYDVVPAQIRVDGVTVALTRQENRQDGLVQVAFASVPWSAMTDGAVTIEILAPNEPYLAFDYALLDTDQIADCDSDSIPDTLDNCRCDANTDQADRDGDGAGDACDPGCQANTECDDGDVCTADRCGADGHCASEPVSCDDGDACTVDTCGASGCANTPVNCDDGNACTVDSCGGDGACVNAPVSCDDGDACTADTCDPSAGCQSVPQCPDCSAAAATAAAIWPPNHHWTEVGVGGVRDPQGQQTAIQITAIRQDEPTDERGDGKTCPDGRITSQGAAVRAERSGLGDGRVYQLSFTARDPDGYSCSGTVRTCVPHDRGGGSSCVDQGARYDSLSCN